MQFTQLAYVIINIIYSNQQRSGSREYRMESINMNLIKYKFKLNLTNYNIK